MSKGRRHPITGRRMNGRTQQAPQMRLPPAPVLNIGFFDNEDPKIRPKPFVVMTTPPQVMLNPEQARAMADGLAGLAEKCEIAETEFNRLSLAMPDERAKLLAMEKAFPPTEEEVGNGPED